MGDEKNDSNQKEQGHAHRAIEKVEQIKRHHEQKNDVASKITGNNSSEALDVTTGDRIRLEHQPTNPLDEGGNNKKEDTSAGPERRKKDESDNDKKNDDTLPEPIPNLGFFQDQTSYFALQFIGASIVPHLIAYIFKCRSIIPIAVNALLSYAFYRKILSLSQDIAWDAERKRGEKVVHEKKPESVEWMNFMLSSLWPIINPDLLLSSVDILEDALQASLPKLFYAVQISDFGQGDTPLRILSLRSLSKEENAEHVDASKTSGAEEEQDLGNHVNLEMEFAYRAAPSGRRVSTKAKNAHLLINFFCGIKGLVGIPLPVWVEMKGVVGKVRMRLQFIPDAPFIKIGVFSLMGLPTVEISAVPLTKSFFNVTNLPVISDLVKQSMNAACAEYIAPKSITMDLAKLLTGDDIKKDTSSLGVLFVQIHSAVELKKADLNGKSDPYVTVQLSKSEKIFFSTRIIYNTLSPIWEEHAFILVSPDAIKTGENLSINLWDSDRMSTDDVLGNIELSMIDLVREPGKMQHREDELSGIKKDSVMPGKLKWDIGFFGKVPLKAELRTDGSDPDLPDDIKEMPEFKDVQSIDIANQSKDDKYLHTENATLFTKPDPDYPSGILSIHIHHAENMELTESTASVGRKFYQIGQSDKDEIEEEGADLPSSYCQIIVNETLVYKTRSKPFTSRPYFNAGTERFITDWKTAKVLVAFRDARNRERNPLIGVVAISLSEAFRNASQVTQFYPLTGGIGKGKTRISILFRATDLTIPKSLKGWTNGAIKITKDIEARDFKLSGRAKVKLKTSSNSTHLYSEHSNENVVYKVDNPIILPLQNRFATPLRIKWRTSKLKLSALAVVWLRDVIENEEKTIEVPIWDGNDDTWFKQNYNTGTDLPDHVDAKQIGTLKLTLSFLSGISHKFSDDRDANTESTIKEAYQADGSTSDLLKKETNTDSSSSDSEGDENGSGVFSSLKNYNSNKDDLERRGRGAMQWSPVRNAKWLKDGIKQKVKKIHIDHNVKKPDVETEV